MLIAQHTYVKIERKMENSKQYEVECPHLISLYRDRVVTHTQEFVIDSVLDFSYREVANQLGFLYLHTGHCMYSYLVKSPPLEFIAAYETYFK